MTLTRAGAAVGCTVPSFLLADISHPEERTALVGWRPRIVARQTAINAPASDPNPQAFQLPHHGRGKGVGGGRHCGGDLGGGAPVGGGGGFVVAVIAAATTAVRVSPPSLSGTRSASTSELAVTLVRAVDASAYRKASAQAPAPAQFRLGRRALGGGAAAADEEGEEEEEVDINSLP